MEPRALDRLLRPNSVAIVGASDKPGALGAAVLANLERQGFAGDIHLVNPKREAIGGRACVPTVAALPEGVDVAVLAIPRAGVVETMRALGERRAGAAVIFSAGFAEGGEAGLAEQREIARIADEAGMVVEGPNCLGLVNFVDGVPLTFVELPGTRLGDRPGIGIVSQSGAMAAVLGVTLLSRAVGLSFSISTGNEAASGVEDYVAHLVDDPHTHVLALIVEQFRKPGAFLAAAARARAAGKPIVLLHPGRSAAARASAATHTGALAGDHQLMATKVRHAGVILVETLEELGDVAEMLLRSPNLREAKAGSAVLCESGAYKALTLDLAEREGLPLPALDDADSPALRAAMPDFVPVSNPLDITAQGLVDPDLYRRTLAALLEDARFGSILIGIIQTDAATAALKFPPILGAIEALRPAKPIVLAGLDEGAAVPPEYVARLRALGVSYFPSSERAVRALARIRGATGSGRDRTAAAPLGLPAPLAAGTVPEYRAKAALGAIGIPFPRGALARDAEEAVRIADGLGYPVVLKAQSSALSHKSDAGGVIVGPADADAVRAAWRRMQHEVAAHMPGISLDGILVEAMGARGLELIVGARNDPDWGPVLLVGMGGIQAEVLKDVRLLAPDLTEEEIASEIGLLASAPLLHGFRGAPPRDVAAVAALVARLGRLVATEPSIREIDLNPVVVYPQGQGAVALDALMLVA